MVWFSAIVGAMLAGGLVMLTLAIPRWRAVTIRTPRSLPSPTAMALATSLPEVLGIAQTPAPAAGPKASISAVPNSPSSAAPNGLVGIFVSEAPSDAGSVAELATVAALGCNVVYNYSAIDGTPAQVRSYLDAAARLGVKVIIGLDSLYGSDGATQAAQMVTLYQAHSAVWGFGVADEKPEGLEDVAQWVPVVGGRYQALKKLTTKPLMAIAVGWSTSDEGRRRAFLANFVGLGDAIAADQYPVPYYPTTGITDLMNDLPAGRQRWFIPQAFSWASYPDTAQGLGYNLSQARFPTQAEMSSMARQARAGGAAGILFYSYFDIKTSPQQLAQLKQVIGFLRSN